MINVINSKTKYFQRKRVIKHRQERLIESFGTGHLVEDTIGWSSERCYTYNNNSTRDK